MTRSRGLAAKPLGLAWVLPLLVFPLILACVTPSGALGIPRRPPPTQDVGVPDDYPDCQKRQGVTAGVVAVVRTARTPTTGGTPIICETSQGSATSGAAARDRGRLSDLALFCLNWFYIIRF